MQSPGIRLGKSGESIAVRHLKNLGYRILEKNYRSPHGEIDIVARQGDTVVFVEVKTRRSSRFGNPKTAVTSTKQRRISMTALHYLKSKNKLQSRARFDVLTVDLSQGANQIELIENAFELAYG